jgi:hypothetical protein
MWDVKGRRIEAARFGSFEPEDVLNYYDGPRIFTFFDSDEGLCLACWSDEDEGCSRYLAAPVTDQIIKDLKAGLLSVYEGLMQPRLWTLDVADTGEVTNAWLIDPKDVPDDCKPQPRVMLHRSLEPIFSLRAIGNSIRAGEVPGSVIKVAVEGARKALKCLAEYEMELPSKRGKPSRSLQRLYDLPVQRTLFASFEVQFRSPLNEPNLFDGLEDNEIQEELNILDRVGQHLRIGLQWLTTGPGEASALPVPQDPELSRIILKALQSITPSMRSPIQTIEIRGDLACSPGKPIRLSQNARNILNGALSRLPLPEERVISIPGLVRELNERLMRFELHPNDGHASQFRICEFEPDLWDRVYEALGSPEMVEVIGVEAGPASPVRVIDLIKGRI